MQPLGLCHYGDPESVGLSKIRSYDFRWNGDPIDNNSESIGDAVTTGKAAHQAPLRLRLASRILMPAVGWAAVSSI